MLKNDIKLSFWQGGELFHDIYSKKKERSANERERERDFYGLLYTWQRALIQQTQELYVKNVLCLNHSIPQH